ncbi:hypothetical protein [Pseudoalteromonas sp. BDTF-M6]|uniref:hypothetical protein n=1 Tax=Pseudoalteromonas sp. BDTF-M6 TaxID=2796132 RepID=UPI001BB039DA|nr:hypothetical protein [Pseudoalteromonas sp. BDTF-M6]MBS3798772.1 hypothetical protein [Pseudoalteromonas sp. BDTF-M6]
MKLLPLVAIISSLILTGCATQPPSSDEIRQASIKRLYDKNLSRKEGHRNIPVTITRDAGLKGMLETVFLKVDGEYVVWLNTREQITIYLSEGAYVFELVNGFCPELPSCVSASDITIKSGFENNFRIKADEDFILVRSKT